MFYTYILYSLSRDRYYIGSTSNLENRLSNHNLGNSRFTKSGIPWTIVYFERYSSKSEAIKREYAIKRKKSRKYIESLINAEGRPE